MGLNIVLNALIGIIPGVGKAFAFWFRPGHRNYNLLKMHMGAATLGATPSTRKDTIFVFTIVAAVLALFAACVVVGVFVSLLLGRALQAHH